MKKFQNNKQFVVCKISVFPGILNYLFWKIPKVEHLDIFSRFDSSKLNTISIFQKCISKFTYNADPPMRYSLRAAPLRYSRRMSLCNQTSPKIFQTFIGKWTGFSDSISPFDSRRRSGCIVPRRSDSGRSVWRFSGCLRVELQK